MTEHRRRRDNRPPGRSGIRLGFARQGVIALGVPEGDPATVVVSSARRPLVN